MALSALGQAEENRSVPERNPSRCEATTAFFRAGL